VKKKVTKVVAGLTAAAFVAASCGNDGGSTSEPADEPVVAESDSGEPSTTEAGADEPAVTEPEGDEPAATDDVVELEYWLWSNIQEPFYRECAADFTALNPNISINLTQFGWGDYWDGLTAGFATGDVPDVFTDHLAKYPEFVDSGVLLPLNDFIERDNVSTDIYWPGLAELWIAPNGDRYGLPKDFDTVALVVNENKLEGSGLSLEDLSNLEWNPEDGGSFEAAIAALSIDANGVRGNEEGFDPSNVVQYGYTGNSSYSDAYGQTGFSLFAVGTGWEYLDSNPWGTEYFYDDPRFTDTMLWLRGLIEKGFIPNSEIHSGSGADTLFADGTVATMTDGSWKIGTWTSTDGVAGKFVPTPVGPAGSRASMYNGLADSITTSSEHPEEAWEWVKYLGSEACQTVIAGGKVVFPAIPSATKIAQDAYAADGVDVGAFTVHVDEGTTFLFPITIEGSEVQNTVGTALDSVLRGEGDAQTIVDANTAINEFIGG